tara:strand:+ start:196 stop:717 length:522 start_codon:yes stop_codon:yes gene_type:complete
MAGLLNTSKVDAAPENAGVSDQILKQIQNGVEAAVPKELKQDYMRVVAAGMRLMYDQKTSKFMDERMSQSEDAPTAVAKGISDLLLLLYNESGKKMSIPAAMLAAFYLMAEALDYAEKVGKVEVTNEVVDQCTEATWKAVTERFGITKDKIDQVIAQSQGGQAASQQQPMAGA